MNGDTIIKAIDEISKKAGEKMQYKTFYLDDKGLRHCIVCKRKLETLINIPSLGVFDKKVNCVCDCGKAQRDAYREEAKRINRASEISINDVFSVPEYAEMTFAKDNAPKSEASQLCRRWAAHYEQNKQKDTVKWLFLYGDKSRTYYAASITNYMSAKGYTARMDAAENIASEVMQLNGMRTYKQYSDYELLIIDDLTADNITDKMLDALYVIINNRKRENKATIITSNMTTEQTGNPRSKNLERIMQVVWDKAYPIEIISEG